jgi:AcrR family transcriptional regulator
LRRSAEQTREHVLEVAHELFYWHGIRATGVDRVAAEAGIAPTTLYRLFASKDELVAAYIERAFRLYREWFDTAAGSGGALPRDQILAVFDALAEQVQPHQCRGCPFLMALAEFPDAEHPARQVAIEMKTWVRERMGELAEQFAATAPVADSVTAPVADPVADPGELADHLALLMEGVYASAQALGHLGPARRARTLAAVLLG